MFKALIQTSAFVSAIALAGAANAADPASTGDSMNRNSANPAPSEMQKSPTPLGSPTSPAEAVEDQYGSYSGHSSFSGTIAGGYSADDLIGASVLDSDGNTIGEIADLLLNNDNTADRVLVDVGGFLGIGEKRVAMKLSEMTRTKDGDEFVTSLTEERLKSQVEYVEKDGRWVPATRKTSMPK